MKKPFQVGDRVRVYREGGPHIGTIQKIYPDGLLRIKADIDPVYCAGLKFHPNQCRRLRPKKRREFWINLYPHGEIGSAYATKDAANNGSSADRTECVRAVEVKREP